MKKIFSILLVVGLLSVAVIGCGPYADYAGTYVSSGSYATVTITLSASGNFTFKREIKNPGKYDPNNNDKINNFEGTYKVDDGVIYIDFRFYSEAKGGYEWGDATARLVGNKLIVTSDQIKGEYTKK